MIISNLLNKEVVSEPAHDGNGCILFRRVLESEFTSKLNFLDYSIIPPHASIGYHQHVGTEEVYIIMSGSGIMTMNGNRIRVKEFDVTVASDGDWHGLENDTDSDLKIIVFEANVL